jgi:O-antigen ligase
MLTYYAPLIVYIISFPVMFVTLFRVEAGILFFIVFVPIISAMKKIVEFPGGNQFADFLLISIVLGWFFGNLRENGRIFRSSFVNSVVILVVIGSIISLIRGYTFMPLSAEMDLIRLKTWKNYMILPLIYFIAVNNINKENFIKWIMVSVCLSLLVMDFNFYTTFRWYKTWHYSDSVRISGPFYFLGPNEMGIFFAMYTFLLLGVSYFIEDKKFKYLVLFVCACNFYPIVYSYSRSGYICTIVGFLILGIIKDRKLLLLLIVLFILYRLVLPNSVVERIDMTFLDKTEISEEQQQMSAVDVGDVTIELTGRKELWEKAMYYFKEQPLLGIGFDSFRLKEGWITHSMFLRILCEEGLVGAAIFSLFSMTVLWQAYKLFKSSRSKLGKGIGLGFFACVLVHLVGSASGETHLYYNMMAIYWLFIGIVASLNINLVNNYGHAKNGNPPL